MKPTISLVSQAGIIPASDICDSAGPMTKSVQDFVDCLDATVDPKLRGKVPEGGYRGCLHGEAGWKGLKVGVLDPELWKMGEELVGKDEEFDRLQVSWNCVPLGHNTDLVKRGATKDAYEKLKEYGAEVKPVEMISIEEFKVGEENMLFDMWGESPWTTIEHHDNLLIVRFAQRTTSDL
jgi:Asp-tRNA(Asn)/Glu-tRNA(Gln) amidotransferase A subunit family amidase